jgi:hypothetical protein
MAASGRLFEAPWHFYAGSVLFLGAFMFLPAALGAIVSLLLPVYVPRTRKGLVLGVVRAGVLGVRSLVTKVAVSGKGQSMDLKLASEVFEHTSVSRIPVLPSYWLSKGILEMAAGRFGTSLFFLGVIAANVFSMALACPWAFRYWAARSPCARRMRDCRSASAARIAACLAPSAARICDRFWPSACLIDAMGVPRPRTP